MAAKPCAGITIMSTGLLVISSRIPHRSAQCNKAVPRVKTRPPLGRYRLSVPVARRFFATRSPGVGPDQSATFPGVLVLCPWQNGEQQCLAVRRIPVAAWTAVSVSGRAWRRSSPAYPRPAKCEGCGPPE